MPLNRRSFLSALFAGAATATLDPERLLWLPGRKLISIPAANTFPFDVYNRLVLEELRNALAQDSFVLNWPALKFDPALIGDTHKMTMPARFSSTRGCASLPVQYDARIIS